MLRFTALLNQELKLISTSTVRFLYRSVSRAMGCLISCFRARNDQRIDRARFFLSDSSRSYLLDDVVSENLSSSLFSSEDVEASLLDYDENLDMESACIAKELRDEAKFLKSCGTLLETPIEIREACKELKFSPPYNEDAGSSDFHTWLPDASINEFQLCTKIDWPHTLVQFYEESEGGPVSLGDSPTSCISSAQSSARAPIVSAEQRIAKTPKSENEKDVNANLHKKIDPPHSLVQFCEESEGGLISPEDSPSSFISNAESSVRVPAVTAEQSVARTPKSANKKDVNANPFDSAPKSRYTGKSVHFGCDGHLYSSEVSEGGGSKNPDKFDIPGDLSIVKPSPKPTPLKLSDDMQTPGTVFAANMDVMANGKSRIRAQYVHPVLRAIENVPQCKVLTKNASKTSQLSDKPKESPGQDRSGIGMDASSGSENIPSDISLRWWHGSGIPNSTSKYKEDQKVNWHATPFEERLEKALSEESFTFQRKHISPIVFIDSEENHKC